jgi:hypothetical protein
MLLLRTTIVVFVCVFCSHLAPAQAISNPIALLTGSWVQPESVPDPFIQEPALSRFTKLEFRPNGVVYLSKNEFERGVSTRYRLEGDTLFVAGLKHIIRNYSNGMLRLYTVTQFGQVFKDSLMRKEKYDSAWQTHSKFAMPPGKSRAIFDGNVSLYDYLFSTYNDLVSFRKSVEERNAADWEQQAPPGRSREDLVIRMSLHIDRHGYVTVEELDAVPEMSSRKTESMRKKIINTSGYWSPAIERGRYVGSVVQLTVIKRGWNYTTFMSRSAVQVERAIHFFQKKDFDASLRYISKAIDFTPENYSLYLFRAGCLVQLGRIDDHCKDVMKAYMLNPFVTLQNTVVVKGEGLEITCGTIQRRTPK